MDFTPETAAFRADYRKNKVGRIYSGPGHFAFTAGASLAVIVFCVLRLDDVRPLEWLTIPLAFFYSNLSEYLGHRFVMHKKRPGLGLVYERHTRQHHRFFTENEMALEQGRDHFAVLFPPVLIVFFLGAFFLPAYFLIAWLLSANVALLFVATGVAYFLNYELFHFAWHAKEGSWIHRVPGLKAMGELHRRHHRPGLMAKANFNITYPISDWLFGTLDLKDRKPDA